MPTWLLGNRFRWHQNKTIFHIQFRWHYAHDRYTFKLKTSLGQQTSTRQYRQQLEGYNAVANVLQITRNASNIRKTVYRECVYLSPDTLQISFIVITTINMSAIWMRVWMRLVVSLLLLLWWWWWLLLLLLPWNFCRFT